MIITVQASSDAPGAWPIARALLEVIEPGSGKHCVEIERFPDGSESFHHHRLDVTITVAHWN